MGGIKKQSSGQFRLVSTKSLLKTMRPLVGSLLNQLPVYVKISVHTYRCVFHIFWSTRTTSLGGTKKRPTCGIKLKAKVEMRRPFLPIYALDKNLSIDYCPYSKVRKLSIHCKCQGKWCLRLSSSSRWSDNLCRVMSTCKIILINEHRLLLSNSWNCPCK